MSALRSQDAGNIVMRSRLSQAKRSWTSAGGGRGSVLHFCLEKVSAGILQHPLPTSPHPHTFQNATRPSSRDSPCPCLSSVVLSETMRIVSKLTHTTNVREPCHTALGSASCCLRGRHCRRRRSPAGAPGSALGAGAGRGRGAARPLGAPAPPLPPSPTDRNDLEVQESHVTSPGG